MEPVTARILAAIDAMHTDETVSLPRTLLRLQTVADHAMTLIEAVEVELRAEKMSMIAGPPPMLTRTPAPSPTLPMTPTTEPR